MGLDQFNGTQCEENSNCRSKSDAQEHGKISEGDHSCFLIVAKFIAKFVAKYCASLNH
jgi:hypothetical protein